MPVIRRSDARTFTLPHGDTTFTGLAAPSRGAKENSCWEVTIPAREAGLEHSLDREELFILLSGRLTATIGGVEEAVGPGDCIIAPAHTTLSLANPHDEPAVAIAVLPVGGQGRIGEGEPFTPPWSV
jgi:mannose-6-phosphate isomerase-like protein (cupin superfamily)